MTIRHCVCDDNHRQGISACAFDGLVIEDCVLSNTKGTPPQAGIDIEPNNDAEPIANLVMRDVRSFGNAGSGYEVMLHHMTRRSRPVSLLFEHCVASNNLNGAVVVGNHVREHDQGRGDVRFADCAFVANRERGLRLTGIPKDTLAVAFDDCTVVGAPASRRSDVTVTTTGARQGLPDNLSFNRLTVVKANGAPWFTFPSAGLGAGPTNITGSVDVVATNGVRTHLVLDAAWAARTFPEIHGGRPVRAMGEFPAFRDVTAVDACPGEMVALTPVANGPWRRQYLLLVAKPMKVRFVLGQNAQKGGPETKRVAIHRILPDGQRPGITNFTLKVGAPQELSFTVRHCPSFYTLSVPSGGAATYVSQCNVPIALDLTGWTPALRDCAPQPFSLWFHVPGGSPFMAYSYADPGDRSPVAFRDPDGNLVASEATRERGVVLADVPASAAKEGLWSVTFARARKNVPCFGQHFATGGLPGYCFLSDRKYWKIRTPQKATGNVVQK